ncbi:TELO2-interacting protein 2 isoform 1-T2 [Salvelinus alpinus]|uniref:TELO2-interacting protein 2 n=1 Tax=Salvelinus sp. IW2-2015 TaxID=2691554 RepID=UPI000CDF7432|nr:TELO2-interacting protein 2 [Salvelinus alpinus]
MDFEISHMLQDLQQGKAPEEGHSPAEPDTLLSRPVAEVLLHVQEKLKAPGLTTEQSGAILHIVEQLFRLGDRHWLFSECCSNQSTDLTREYVDFVSSLTLYAALPLCDNDSGTLPESSFEATPARACVVSSVVLALVQRLGNGGEAVSSHCQATSWVFLTGPLAPLLCVFALTHMQEQAWTSEASRTAASNLLDSVVQAGDWETTSQLLFGKNNTERQPVLGSILEILQSDLKRDSWKRNQATKHVFAWILMQVGRPWLADYLEKVFPPSLLMSDDYCTDNQVLGVRCLNHIVLNVPAADLCQYNRAQVLYHALFNHLYTSEPQLIEVVLPCLIDLLPVLEKDPACTGLPRKPNRYDEVLRLTLTHMEMEHKLALRSVYAKFLEHLIEKMGIVIVRHLKRLERVIIGYLEISDGPEEQTRLAILDALEKTLLIAWPRMECRLSALVQSLLRLLCDLSTESIPPAVREELVTKATHCLLLLDHCTQGKLKMLLKDVDSSCTSTYVLRCIETVTMAQR